MTPDESVNRLFENILTAHEMLLKDQIIANTVVLNGNKFAKWVKPGYRPTIFGMAVEYDNLPEDIDFLVQYKEPKPMTNAGRIRSMTDEELSKFLCSMFVNGSCCYCIAEQYCEYGHTGMIDWLQQEATDD